MFTIRKLFFFTLALTPWILLPGNVAATNLVENGGFETGDFTDWSVTDPQGYVGINSIPIASHNSTYSAFIGEISPDEGILSQTLATTPGALYDFEFWLQNDNTNGTGTPPDNYFKVTWNGVVIYSGLNLDSFTYTDYQFTVTGTGSDVLQFVAQNNDSDGYFYLDDVSVQQVPEPASALLVGLGGVLLGAVRRRRRDPAVRPERSRSAGTRWAYADSANKLSQVGHAVRTLSLVRYAQRTLVSLQP